MKILFSPSEAKVANDLKLDKKIENILPKLNDKQKHVLNIYQDFIKTSSNKELSKLFGLKKQSDIDLFKSINIFSAKTLKAVERYSGTAYKYLDYENLENKKFIDENLIIFSNLFGPILAQHSLPNYKLKQGEKIGSFVVEKYYKENFSSSLDNLLENEFVIDLRAGFYLKFYTVKKHHITLKFIKDGKSVSHWAKAYRGKIAKDLAHFKPENEDAFQKISFANLQIREIIKRKLSNEYIFDIV